jgi:Subtilisin inhibitor-like
VTQPHARRELLVRVTATPVTGPALGHGPEVRSLAECCVYNRGAGQWEAHFGDLDEDARRRLAALLHTADEFGTQLHLSAVTAPNEWREPVLRWPIPLRPYQTEQHAYIDPDGATTMLVIDVNAEPGGPVYHWWLSAEPPMGTHPALEEACRLLREIDGDPFAPFEGPSEDAYYGPNRATIRGFWRGRWIQAEFSLVDGGERYRWHNLVPLLPEQ